VRVDVGIHFQAGLPALLQEIFRRVAKAPATAPLGMMSDSLAAGLERAAGRFPSACYFGKPILWQGQLR
jgi:hypothetical protein